MRYIIYGAGAIGGVVGGRLFAAGKETVLICRGRHLDAIREVGLTLKEAEGERLLRLPAVGRPDHLTFVEGDVVIMTMKSQDTAAALDDLEAAGGGDVAVICCQNGVANERIASRRFERVYAMLVALPATFLDPGVVVGWGGTPYAGVLDAGCFPSGTDALIEQVAADLADAGFLCRCDPAVMRLKYTKLIANLGNALQALTSFHRSDEPAKAIMAKVRQEAMDCFAAAGIPFATADEYREHVSRHYMQVDVPGADRGGSSTWQSLSKGHRRLETDYLNGEIVLLGRLYGLPTPFNAALRRLSQQLATEGRGPGSYTIADVEALAGRYRHLTVDAVGKAGEIV